MYNACMDVADRAVRSTQDMGIVLSKPTVSDGRLLQVIEAHDGGVHCLSVNEDSTLLATGGQDGLVRRFQPRERERFAAGRASPRQRVPHRLELDA